MMNLYQILNATGEHISYDSTSIGTIYGVQIEVKYRIKNAGTVVCKYYLTRLPASKPKTLHWSTMRHEMKLFFAANLAEAMNLFVKPPMQQDDAFLISTIPVIKNASIEATRLFMTEFHPDQPKFVDLQIPKPDSVKKTKEQSAKSDQKQ